MRDGKECRLYENARTAQRLRLRVVRCHLQRPDVAPQGLLTAGGVLLRTVGSIISSHLRGVFEAGIDRSRDSSKALTLLDLRGLDRRGTSDRIEVAQINAQTVFTGGRGYTVGSEYHLLISRMRRLLVDLGQCTTDRFKHLA